MRANFDTFGGGMAKQQKYPEVYLGDPEIDFVMLAKSQRIEGRKVTGGRAAVGAGADSTWHQRFKLRH